MEFNHIPVLFRPTIEFLDIKPDGIYVDGTLGGGGHSKEIVKHLTTGALYSIDQDPDAIAVASQRLKEFPNSHILKGNFSNMKKLLAEQGVFEVDGVLLDIGVSSYQLDTAERGFSFHKDAPLDMRMSQQGTTAADLCNTLPWQQLAEIFTKYGEEKFSKSIAQGIVKEREINKIETTEQLVEIIRNNVPASVRREGHPARKVFQALRVEVNGELDALSKGLDEAFDMLKVGGRLAVISFHSLEDRMIKVRMNEWCKGCTCPPDFPVCVCHKTPRAKLINKKPIEATPQELEENPRSRSAKLRVCTKLK